MFRNDKDGFAENYIVNGAIYERLKNEGGKIALTQLKNNQA